MLNIVIVKLAGFPPSPAWYRTICAGRLCRRCPPDASLLTMPRKRRTNSGISSSCTCSRLSRCSCPLMPSFEVRQSGQTSTRSKQRWQHKCPQGKWELLSPCLEPVRESSSKHMGHSLPPHPSASCCAPACWDCFRLLPCLATRCRLLMSSFSFPCLVLNEFP